MDQLIEFLKFGQVPKKSVLISIDDGWISSYKIAYPILRDFGFSATLFIPSHFIESGKRSAVSWDQIKEMVSDNTIDIQCHTKSHRDLSTIKYNESFTDYIQAVEQDILHSKQTIYDRLGKEVIALAYPFGNTNPLVMEIIKKFGYKAAFTVKRKSNPFYKQNFLLNRAMIFGTYNINRFAKNLKTFEELKIIESEPIDTLSSLGTLALNSPEEYERKKQWRTALLAWKLRRDKLLSEKLIDSKKSDSQSLNDSLLKAKQKIFQLTHKLNDISKQYYSVALKNINNEEATKSLLQTLLYQPKSQAIIDRFQTQMGKFIPLSYQVKENDSFSSIAKQLYQDPKKAILIPFFNDNIKD
ncbi:MAG: polysaccharide deacetylase family protein, partial [Methylococcales bacterium]|nr:polysaccharide deacetylase family protein [Methylococcales bacterium]